MRRRFLVLFFIALVMMSALSAAAARRRGVRHPDAPSVALPVATADSYSANQGSTITVAAPGVLANDTLNGAVLIGFGPTTGSEQTVLGNSTQTTRGGMVTVMATGGFTYTAPSTFSGNDVFKYFISNSAGSASATVTIDVRATATAVNAVNDEYRAQGASLTVPAPGVLANDTLAGGRIISFGPRTGTEQTSFTGSTITAQGGSVSLGQDGSFIYLPPPPDDDGYGYSRPFTGLDTFVYVIQSGSATSTATVGVTVER